MKDRVLLVDDEPNVLHGYKRGLRGRFDVHTAEGGERGLEELARNGPFSVVVADMRMPIMDGVQFLKKVKRLYPETVRMMLTGNADQETAMNAVNQGNIFRFLTKPCPSNELIAALALGVRQYNLITAEKEVLEKTLSGSIKVMTDLLSITDPDIMNKFERVRDLAVKVASPLDLDSPWELEVAAMLAPLGFLTLPPELRTKVVQQQGLTDAEREAVFEVPQTSARLAGHIPRLEQVADIIANGTGKFGLEREKEKPLDNQSIEIKTMRILCELVEMESRGVAEEKRFRYIQGKPWAFDLELASKIEQIIERGGLDNAQAGMSSLEVRTRDLINGDVLAQNVESLDDRLLLSKGTVLTQVYLARLHNYRRLVGIQEPIRIYRKNIG